LGVITALAMMLLSMYPQIHFWVVRGSSWHGAYAPIEGVGDEVAYSAYVNALIQGRPRRNDPYTGRDAAQRSETQSDSLFSIQFVPAYGLAFLARVFGLSASSVFILLTPLAAGATAILLFWLLTLVTRNEELSAAGTLLVLCLGTLVGGSSHVVRFFGSEPLYSYLMFLRRYQPAASFPLLLLFFAMVWQAIRQRRRIGRSLLLAIGAAVIFWLLVFSYVYLWTAALAWLVCVAIILLIAQPPDWKRSISILCAIAVASLTALIPFLLLFANRGSSLDAVQALERSHQPDLHRLPLLLGLVIIGSLAYLVWRKSVELTDPRLLFAASFAILPVAVFNQQVITGQSLQPLHYEMFVANYCALVSLIVALPLALSAKRKQLSRKVIFWIALAAFEWGGYETFVATAASMPNASQLDEARPAVMRLSELGRETVDSAKHATVLSTDLLIADALPTSAPQPVLWAPHMLVFSGATASESRERFYQYLYYSGVDADQLREILTEQPRYGYAVGMFGFERTIKGLSKDPKPISSTELDHELAAYRDYCEKFSEEDAHKTPLSYLIANATERNLANLDRWYERDSGEQFGRFILYRLKLREDGSKESGDLRAFRVFSVFRGSSWQRNENHETHEPTNLH
jgi:hypothetical protein